MNDRRIVGYTGILLVLASLLFITSVYATGSGSKGSITVCKIIVDPQGNIVTGSALPGAQFSISGIIPAQTSGNIPAGKIGKTNWTTPLSLNTDVIGNDNKDAKCVKYSDLVIGTYYYGEESTPAQGWDAPKYNDQYSTQVSSLNDFFAYDGRLFDGNAGNDGGRNLNADGDITLTSDRKDRTLIVLNKYKTAACGNGIKENGEQCDDSNLINGDGCDSQCKLEENTCEDIDGNGWFGEYYNYMKSHPDMNLPSGSWPDKTHGDPLGAWNTDWYNNAYFRFSRVDASLTFGENFFPFDTAPEQIDNGHDYHFGAHWRAMVNASAGNYNYVLTSDDDSWVYKDGVLVIDNSGVHSPTTKSGSMHLDGSNVFDIFFAERHTVRSHMYFKFTSDGVKIIPLPKDCEKCGDGIKQATEQCDDGNLANNDGCSNVCKLESCGDGIKQTSEQCDDGNTNSNDGCSNQCKLEICGDGIKQTSEQCDDGNANNNDLCSNICKKTACGDGIIQNPNGFGQAETCDDGNTNNNDGCSSMCKLESCGDGIKQTSEQCDDGNAVNNDGCSNTCKLPVCGDAILQAGEQCDDGNLVNNDTCSNACKFPVCGDGIKQNGEQCDDGNTVNSDACTNACKLPFCGDLIIQAGETCDDGNNANGDGCNSVCQQEACGNGILDVGEQCDDNNNVDGDGCSAICRTEFCGDIIINNGEQCDDGNTANGDGCSSICNTEFCSDGTVQPSETCEPPNTTDSSMCGQSTSTCSGAKLGTRDAFGVCNSVCGCTPDTFIFQCVVGQCGAVCDAPGDFTLNGSTCTFGCNDDTCSFTSICSTANKCEGNVYFFSGQCTGDGCSFSQQDCDSLDNKEAFVNYCSDDTIRTHRKFNDFSCGVGGCQNTSSFIDDSLVQDCNALDGYYDTGARRNISTGQCTEKEQKEQVFRNYTCSSTPGVNCTYVNTTTQWVDTGSNFNKPDYTVCDDGLFCTTNDVCIEGVCGGAPRVCESDTCNIGSCDEVRDMCISIAIPDNTTPVTTKVYGQPYYSNGTSEWINSSTTITLVASDSLVCPSTTVTYYRVTLVPDINCRDSQACQTVASNGAWNTYSSPFTIGEQSCHLIEFNSVDNSGNNETRHRQCAFVDNSDPTVNKTVGQPRDLWEGDNTFYPGLTEICNEPGGIDCWKVTLSTPITLACNDQQPHPVGNEELHFIINLDGDDATQAYCSYYGGVYNSTGDGSCVIENPITIAFLEESQHNLLAYCTDALGNKGPIDDEKFKVEGRKFTIHLNKKWNLISVPFRPISTDVNDVFADVVQNITSVWAYDGGQWYVWTPGPEPDTLADIFPGFGYWVLAKENSTLSMGGSLFGQAMTPPSKNIDAGWNLIGYYDDTAMLGYYNGPLGSGNTALCELGTLTDTAVGNPKWNSLYTYWEPLPSKWIPLDYSSNMDAGAGYWVQVDTDDLYSPATTCSAPIFWYS